MTPTKGKARHTKGPWSVSRDGVPEWHKQFTVYSEQGERVATAFLSEANARLISAAPSLLEALKALLVETESLHRYANCDRVNEGLDEQEEDASLGLARDAIKLAEGE